MPRVSPIWILLAALPVACQAPEQEDTLRLDRGDYNRAFLACIEAGREQDMPPALADRGNGVIETEPRLIGSLLEPWRTDSSGIDQTLQATVMGRATSGEPRRQARPRTLRDSTLRPSRVRSSCARACSSSAASRPASVRTPGAERCAA